MKLTMEQLSKQTKLSVATLRVYVSRQKLGTKVGNRRVFSQSDVQKILKNSQRSKEKSKGKTKTNVGKAARKPTRVRATKQLIITKKAPLAKRDQTTAKPEKQSFWRSFFGTKKPKQKVNILEAEISR
jgi:DNA-binding transcriptional MerR regulator